MKQFILLSLAVLLSINTFSQQKSLSDYNYVIVPEHFDFLSSKDQYQINSMTKFYLDKYGFNTYFLSSAPKVDRCDGLYADVEKLSTILGTKLQVVLKDCNNNEIYRSSEGKSKFKQHQKSYQDALRKAFKGMQRLGVNQQEVNPKDLAVATPKQPEKAAETPIKVLKIQSEVVELQLPEAKFSNYSHSGKSYLLRKTAEGYSFYEETATVADGLLLKGKIIVMDAIVKYMDTAGAVFDAEFDAGGNLTIKSNDGSITYILKN